MKNYKPLFVLITIFLFSINCFSQNLETAGAYMSYIGMLHKEIAKDVLGYTSAVAHGKSARKVENRRQGMMQEIKDAQKKVNAMPPFKGDKTLKDSTLGYLKTSLIVLNEEYGKIMNMEDIAEQSYDAMEAYMLAQEVADDHINKSNERLRITTHEFADKYKVRLLDSEDDEVNKKMKITNKVNRYHRMVYLVFFKCNKQEVYLVDAISKKNINGIEQNKNMLLQYTTEGLSKLDTMKALNNDRTLVNAAKQALIFYQMECKDKMTSISEYMLREDAFNKMQKTMSAKRENEKTKEDVDLYNKGVAEFNGLVNNFNATTNFLNSERTKILNNWTRTSAAFLDKHTP